MFGRHASRYQTAGLTKISSQPSLEHQAEVIKTIQPDDRLLDIANANLGKIRINCWPSPEGRGRRWGKVKDVHAAVMQFRIGATTDRGCHIRDFELDILFSAPAVARSSSTETQSRSDDPNCLRLIELPSPRCLQSSVLTSSGEKWTFKSESISDSDGRATSARWLWNGESRPSSLLLHGGIAIAHPCRPFRLRCQIRGRASYYGFRLRFSNDQNGVWWQLEPNISNEDIEEYVSQLEEDIIQCHKTKREPQRPEPNLLALSQLSDAIRDQGGRLLPTSPITGNVQPRSSGPFTMTGHSTSHIGDNIHNYNLCLDPNMTIVSSRQ